MRVRWPHASARARAAAAVGAVLLLGACGPQEQYNNNIPANLQRLPEGQLIFPGAYIASTSGNTRTCAPDEVFSSHGRWTSDRLVYEIRTTDAEPAVVGWYAGALGRLGWTPVPNGPGSHFSKVGLGGEGQPDDFNVNKSTASPEPQGAPNAFTITFRHFSRTGACDT